MTQGPYHKVNPYDELQAVVLGNYYTPDYFDFVSDPAVGDPLRRISEEILEDLDHFAGFLTSQGCRVLRPSLPSREEFARHHDATGQFLSPPLCPRDHHTVVGNRLYRLGADHDLDPCIDSVIRGYNSQHYVDLHTENQDFFSASMAQHQDCRNTDQDIWYSRRKYQELAGPDWPAFERYVAGDRSDIPAIQQELDGFADALRYETREIQSLQGPNVIPLNDRVVVDSTEFCDYAAWVSKHMPTGLPSSQITTKASHSDGCFVVCGPGTIIGIDPLIDYGRHFPGYRVIPVPPESYQNHLDAFFVMKDRVGGRWWVPGQEHNDKFINFVELYLKDWTGHVYETVFDVNVVAVNPQTVCVANHDPVIFEQLRQQGIDPVIIPWRHRFFVDSGLHCLTLDLCRGNPV